MRTWFAICLILSTLGCTQEGVQVPEAPTEAGESRLVDRHGDVVEDGAFAALREGDGEVRLTLDGGLQGVLDEALAPLGERGAAAVLDARTGEVLAMRRALEAHPTGSIFKPVSMLGALEAGYTRPERTVTCEGHVDIGQRRFRCFKSGGHGPLDLSGALATSCNAYAYTVGEQLGLEGVAKAGQKLGLSMATGVGLAEDVGSVEDGASDVPGMAASAATGHGPVRATPLQMARAYAGLATGRLPKVRLLADSEAASEVLGADPEKLQVIREGLRAAVGSPQGTARGIETPGLAIAGKTGTIAPSRGAEGKDHGWFVGYAPAESPQVVVAVFVAHGGSGSRSAAPVAQRLIKAALD